MSHLCIVVAVSAIVVSGVQAQERQPFHVAQFSDSRTVSLAIMSSMPSDDLEYDFEVGIGLTELEPGGRAIFVDENAHAVRVRCEAPRSVKVGGSVHILPHSPQTNDWKQDLWRALCLHPLS